MGDQNGRPESSEINRQKTVLVKTREGDAHETRPPKFLTKMIGPSAKQAKSGKFFMFKANEKPPSRVSAMAPGHNV